MYELHFMPLSFRYSAELTARGANRPPSDFYFVYESHFTLLGSRYSASSLRRAKSAPWTSTSCTSSTSRC